MGNKMNLSIDRMTGYSHNCECGKKHSIEIRNIEIGKGVSARVPEIIADFKSRRALLVADKNTYNVAGKKVEALLQDFKVNRLVFEDEMLVPDEKAVGRLLMEAEGAELLVTVGSGTLNDISRFVSVKLNIPYIIVCTAPSMDGYASTTSPLIMNGLKLSFNGVYPSAIVADIDIMKDAPMHMLGAGLGDVLGKYTALADWMMGHILNDEYYCRNVADIVENVIQKCVEASPALPNRDPDAVQRITEALVLSGTTIGMVGTSRPVSGEEHQLAHSWEMIFLAQGRKTHWLHGNKVGVATGVVLEAYKFLSSLDVNGILSSGKYRLFNRDGWERNIRGVYGRIADNIIATKQGCILMKEEQRESFVRKVSEKWNDLKKQSISSVPQPEELQKIMKQAGAVYHPAELGIDRELFRKTLVVAKDIRNKYGVMQLLEDLGVLEDAADHITQLYYR